MPFPVPVFSDLVTQAQGDFARILGAVPTLRRSVTGVLARICAALAVGLYQYVTWIITNVLLPDTAMGAYLDRWANIVGLAREAASSSTGGVVFSNATNGLVVSAGAQLTDASGTVVLVNEFAALVSGNTLNMEVVSLNGGAAANLAAGSPVTLSVGIAGIPAIGVVGSGGLNGGTDQESDANLRIRVLARLANPPQGGAVADYVAWAKLVPGVTRVWVYPLQTGPNTVTIIFTMDGRANIIPLSGDVAAVQAMISAKRPVTSQPTTIAPTPDTSINVTISNLTIASGYTLATVQANILSALQALFVTTTPGGTGYDSVAQKTQAGGMLKVEQIDTAIGNAAGVSTFDLSAPSADIAEGFGIIPQLGTVTYS